LSVSLWWSMCSSRSYSYRFAVDDVLARRVPVHLPEPEQVRQAVDPHAARPGRSRTSPCMTSWARLTSSPGTTAEGEMGGHCGARRPTHSGPRPTAPYRRAYGPVASAAKLDSMGLHVWKPPQAQQMIFLTTLRKQPFVTNSVEPTCRPEHGRRGGGDQRPH
jgi:hypothetical protein